MLDCDLDLRLQMLERAIRQTKEASMLAKAPAAERAMEMTGEIFRALQDKITKLEEQIEKLQPYADEDEVTTNAKS